MENRPYTLRRGLYVLGQGIRQSPVVFSLAVLGSALYGVMTAGTAWALRRVTAQYLRLPLSWHGRHPTGQLLSNANADVEATWQVFAPLPMAIGVVVMLVVAAVLLVLPDPPPAPVGVCVLPLLFPLD